MKVIKMPKENIKCECGCEFYFDEHDINAKTICGDNVQMTHTYTICPYCHRNHTLTELHNVNDLEANDDRIK